MDEINHEVKKCEEKLDQSIAPVKQIISNLKNKIPFFEKQKNSRTYQRYFKRGLCI